MTNTPESVDTVVIFDLTKRGKWEELEEVWLQLVSNPPIDAAFYSKLITGMIKRKAEDRLDQMLGLLVQTLAENGRASVGLKIALSCLKRLEQCDALRDGILVALDAVYGKRPNYAQFVELTEVKTSPDVRKSLARFLTLSNYDVSESFQHKSWGVGTVTKIDPVEQRVILNFPNRPPAEFTLTGAREYLVRLPRAHFLAQVSRAPKSMSQMAKDDPARFTRMAIKSLGPVLKVVDLKLEMSEYLMEESKWKNWWSRSRDKIRVDPYIEFRGIGLNAKLALRDKPKSVHEQALEDLMDAETPRKRMDAVRAWVRVSRRSPIIPEKLTLAEEWLTARFNTAPDDATRAEALFLFKGLAKIEADHGERPAVTLADIVTQTKDPLALVTGLNVFEYQAPTMDAIRESREDWLSVYETIIPDLNTRLSERGLAILIEGQHLGESRHIAESLLANPRRNPLSHLWALTKFIHNEWEAFAPPLSVELMGEHLMEFFTELTNSYDPRADSATEMRTRINACRNFFEEKHHANIRKLVSLMELSGAKRFFDQLSSHNGLDDTERAHISGALRAERPELEVKVEEDILTSAYLYVTAQSLQTRREELHRIQTVLIPANSKRIGEAAAMGDLSENAEYESAREEQNTLMHRANELEEDLRFVRVMQSDEVKADRVWPGTRVGIRYEADDSQIVYSILGPWDAQPEANILSYRSPLGSQFIKRKVGDSFDVTLPSEEVVRCTIESIENALQ